MLTGTAMRAISRAGVGGADRRSREMGMAGRGMRVPFDNEVGEPDKVKGSSTVVETI
jgi:hypothetical protein